MTPSPSMVNFPPSFTLYRAVYSVFSGQVIVCPFKSTTTSDVIVVAVSLTTSSSRITLSIAVIFWSFTINSLFSNFIIYSGASTGLLS